MLESAQTRGMTPPAIPQSEDTAQERAPSSLKFQIGLIREAALSLLSQLEPLRREQPTDGGEGFSSLYDEVRRFEIQLIINALSQTQGHQQKAARLLGIKATTLNSKIKRYKIPFLRGFITEGVARIEDAVEG